MSEVKWYERGEIGERIRDLLDFWDNERCIAEMEELGLSSEEILEVLLKDSEEYDDE